MNKFRVLVRGENFEMKVEGAVKRLGFFVTRFVVAESQAEAETRAIETVSRDDRLRDSVLNDASNSPMLFADEIEEVSCLEDMERQDEGFAFFDE